MLTAGQDKRTMMLCINFINCDSLSPLFLAFEESVL